MNILHISQHSIRKLIFLLCLCGAVTPAISQDYRIREFEECEEIANVCTRVGIGFPFNQPYRLKYNGYTFVIGKRIQELSTNRFWEDTNYRKGMLRDIIHDSWKKANNLPIEGFINYGALQEKQPDIDVSLLLAAMVIAGHTGDIMDIEPFLEFAPVFYGTPGESKLQRTFISYTDEEINRDLSPNQAHAFWPAANAINSNTEIVKPLLMQAIKNESLNDVLRWRAAAFLHEMDSMAITPNYVNTIENRQTAKIIQLIVSNNYRWKTIYPGLGNPHPERMKLIERDRKYRELINERYKPLPSNN
ncbi:MAG TPA: hypothetical protein PLH79_19925 [bacterium]|nr:hypothetical protein [Candidatus Omnitrophota bacterium]HOL96618.1 hypothetical protein [bacterium]HPP00752.1 hypothetical protein [bacterium]